MFRTFLNFLNLREFETSQKNFKHIIKLCYDKKIVNETGLGKAKRFLIFPQYWQQSESGRQKKLNHSLKQ